MAKESTEKDVHRITGILVTSFEREGDPARGRRSLTGRRGEMKTKEGKKGKWEKEQGKIPKRGDGKKEWNEKGVMQEMEQKWRGKGEE